MKCNIIKNIFLDFFLKKKHKIIPSFPIVSKNDPTIFFINAGMNPFKDYFIGHRIPKYKRIANIQRCLRVTGKHNDLEQVGLDSHHHTMFEMLGNWSFGDYSREKAITWAWELLVNVYNIPKENIYISIFIGDKQDNLSMDIETLKYWRNLIDKNNIFFLGKKENFWEMGNIGPCGPCTEIYIDLRNKKEKHNSLVKDIINKKHSKVIEIWNIVFIEFFRKHDGSLTPLPEKHVDTGMGLERLCMVLQEKTSSYETDIFFPIIKHIKESLGNNYQNNKNQNITTQIISDHLRAVICSIYDGQLPTNNESGYVIKKILRRAMIYMNRFLHQKKPFLHNLIDFFIEKMKDTYNGLEKRKKYIKETIKKEEISFFNTIEKGNKKIVYIIKETKEKNKKIVDVEKIFQLYDTYGYPIELSKMIIKKNNLLFDENLFVKRLSQQRKRYKEKENIIVKENWIEVIHNKNFSIDENLFVGYNCFECNVIIKKYRKVKNKINNTNYYEFVFDKTPFYPKGGGQLGDIGIIKNLQESIIIFDTNKEKDIILHSSKKLPTNISSIFRAEINKIRRKNIENNHTSTHLLYFSLKRILGNHIKQRGSYIGNDYLRFDFSHNEKITLYKLKEIEDFVQKLIFTDIPLIEKKFNSLQEAKKNISFYNEIFENKYITQSKIRVITFGESSEFCIGTHVSNTKLIKVFKILSEEPVSQGIRRIKAITSDPAIIYFKDICHKYDTLKINLNNPKSLTNAFIKLKDDNKKLKKEISIVWKNNIKLLKKEYAMKTIQFNSVKYICDFDLKRETGLNMITAKNIFLELRNEIPNLFSIVGFIEIKKPMIFISISDSIIKDKNINAKKIINKISNHIEGKYWGNSYFSAAIGSKIDGLKYVYSDVMIFIKETFKK
ncbi:alanine--tRNA ligase [Blattabacterium cuenoti]|uniref:alanine--tRNA ligase n=1 Tax=Blattabacterium cuenoti TaxID=1653831 RepID=UPI00163D0D20|nr:alanine--tRNA ligase [Blattabacterium cuenoti]